MRVGVRGVRGVQIAIAMLIVISIVELGFFFALRNGAHLYNTNDRFPIPSGYLLDGKYLAAKNAPCYLIRISSDSCPYCRLDHSQYARLLQEAQKAKCETIILAPIAGEMKLKEDSPALQLQYVDLKLGRTLKPFMTPETILLDGTRRPTWQREGSIDNGSLAQALRALAKLP